MFDWIGSVISAIGSLIGIKMQNKQQDKINAGLTGSQKEQNQWNAEQAEISRDFNAAEAQKSRDFTEYMARNKYSMETQSMQDAGLNPAMVYGGGNLVSTASNGAAASSSPAQGQGSGNAGIVNMLGLIEPLMALVRQPLEMQKLRQDIEESKSREGKNKSETHGQDLQNQITEESKEALVEANKLTPVELQAKIDNIKAKTDSERLNQQLTGWQILQEKLSYEQNQRMNDLLYQYQQLQNAYKATENAYQERMYNAQLDKIAAEVNELFTRAKKNMSDIQVNNAQIALYGEQTKLTSQQTLTEKERTRTENIKGTHEAVNTWKDYNDPKAHFTNALVSPFQALHDFKVSGRSNVLGGIVKFGKESAQQWRKGNDEGPYGKGKFKSHKEYLRYQTECLADMYNTAGQAFEEYGED